VKIDNFFAELKQRNVYKIAAAYAVIVPTYSSGPVAQCPPPQSAGLHAYLSSSRGH
jgi:hypothetical protein